MNRKRILGIVGLTLFIIGALWGGLWLGSELAARLGASTVNVVSALPDNPMPLQCPAVLALHETGTLTASVPNPSTTRVSYDVSFSTLVEQAQMTLPSCDTALTVNPGNTGVASCEMEPSTIPDFVAGNHISIRASAVVRGEPRQLIPYQATCIIQVTRNPDLSGKQRVAMTLVPIMVLMLLGAALWIIGVWPFSRQSILGAILITLPVLGWLGVIAWYLRR